MKEKNVTIEALFRAETLKNLKFPPEMFLNSIVICIFATALGMGCNSSIIPTQT